MRREDKYPETKYFKYYNANPKNKITSDCTIRAIATFLNQDYIETYKEMFELSLKTGYIVEDVKNIDKYLKDVKHCTKCAEPRKYDNTKMSLKEYLDKNPNITIMCYVGSHHATVVKNGKCLDIWNCTSKTLHTFYIR